MDILEGYGFEQSASAGAGAVAFLLLSRFYHFRKNMAGAPTYFEIHASIDYPQVGRPTQKGEINLVKKIFLTFLHFPIIIFHRRALA